MGARDSRWPDLGPTTSGMRASNNPIRHFAENWFPMHMRRSEFDEAD